MNIVKVFTGSAAIRVSGAAAQLLLTLTVARFCGAEQAGFFFFGYSLIVILSTLARIGSELSGLRAVAPLFETQNEDELRSVVDSRLALVSGISLLLAVGLGVLAGPIAHGSFGSRVESVLWLSALAIPPMAMIGLVSEVLKGAQRAWLALTVQNVGAPTVTVVILVAEHATVGLNADRAAAAVVASSWVVAVGAMLAWRRVLAGRFGSARGGFRINRGEVVNTLREAPSLLIVSTTSVVMQWIGATILGFLASAPEVSGYSVAMRISIAVSIVHSAAASVVGPQMSIASAAGQVARLKRVCHQTSVMITAITWPALVTMMVLAPLCMAVFGQEYRDFASVLRILLVGQLVAAVIGHSGTVLVMSGHYSSARWSSVAAALALAALSVLAIPVLEARGAATAMASAVVIGHLAGFALVRRQLGIWSIPVSLQDFARLKSDQPEAVPDVR